MSSRRKLGWVLLWAVSAALSVAWLIEASTVGRGFISTYLAPFAIVGNLVTILLSWKRPVPPARPARPTMTSARTNIALVRGINVGNAMRVACHEGRRPDP